MNDLKISVVMPYYKRIREFRQVLPLNAPYFSRPGHEVILALDEPSEEADVLQLVRDFPSIRWRVIVNDFEHPWRPPCCAINVGIQHALGEHVLVVSPESAFVTDLPEVALANIAANPGTAALGCVSFGTFDTLQARGGSLREACSPQWTPYGSICAPRESLVAVHGYDESLDRWGGDDDNLRIRLMMNETYLHHLEDMRILHLSFEPRAQRPANAPPPPPEYAERVFQPASAQANPDGWGRSFNRIAWDWRKT